MSENRSLVTVSLDRAATTPPEAYNPAFVVDAVNALWPFGKEEALSQVDFYLANHDGKPAIQGLFWVLRALFDMPAGRAFPPVRIGSPVIPPPAESAALPRFPMVEVLDIPFLAVDKFVLAGKAEPVGAHLAYYRAHGLLRARTLTPPASLEGIEQAFLRAWMAAYGTAYAEEAVATIRAQIARMRN